MALNKLKLSVMNRHIQHYNLKPGDEIIVPKSGFNIVQHHALYLGYDEQNIDWIIENAIGIGVRLIMANDFFRNNPKVNEIRKFHGTNQQRRQLVERALKKVGAPYDLINYNCQHFTSDVKTGKPVSKQVEGAVIGLVLILFFGALLSD